MTFSFKLSVPYYEKDTTKDSEDKQLIKLYQTKPGEINIFSTAHCSIHVYFLYVHVRHSIQINNSFNYQVFVNEIDSFP